MKTTKATETESLECASCKCEFEITFTPPHLETPPQTCNIQFCPACGSDAVMLDGSPPSIAHDGVRDLTVVRSGLSSIPIEKLEKDQRLYLALNELQQKYDESKSEADKLRLRGVGSTPMSSLDYRLGVMDGITIARTILQKLSRTNL